MVEKNCKQLQSEPKKVKLWAKNREQWNPWLYIENKGTEVGRASEMTQTCCINREQNRIFKQ